MVGRVGRVFTRPTDVAVVVGLVKPGASVNWGVVRVFIVRGHRRARPGGAVILHQVGCEALAHRRVHPGGGMIVHYTSGKQRAFGVKNHRSTAATKGCCPARRGRAACLASLVVQNQRSTATTKGWCPARR
jgi:hypothetical protein